MPTKLGDFIHKKFHMYKTVQISDHRMHDGGNGAQGYGYGSVCMSVSLSVHPSSQPAFHPSISAVFIGTKLQSIFSSPEEL